MKNLIANFPGVKLLFNYVISFYIKLKNVQLKIGYNNEFRKVSFGRNIQIGNNVSIKNTSIGDFSYVSDGATIRNCDIGKFCSIGPNFKVGLGKHPFNEFVSSHPLFYSERRQVGFSFIKKSIFNEFEKVVIGNDVWIGANVLVLDGIKIGDGAVLAAGSVVTKDVLPYSLVAGVPAVHKKYKFGEKKIEDLLKDRWWDKDLVEIEKMILKKNNIKL